MTDSSPSSSTDATDDVETTKIRWDRRRARGWLQQPRRTVVLYVAIFVIAEAIGAFVSPQLAAAIYGAMTVLALNEAIYGYRSRRTAGVVMAALFSSRLLIITLPALGVSGPTRAAFVGALNLLAVFFALQVLRIDLSASRDAEGFPLRHSRLSKAIITVATALTGVAFGWGAFAFLDPAPLVTRPLAGTSVLPTFIACGALALGALSEEMLYRRLVPAMVHHTAKSQTPLFSALLFASTYLGTHNAGFIAVTFVAGAVFAWSCEHTGDIRGPVVAHAIASILAYIVFP